MQGLIFRCIVLNDIDLESGAARLGDNPLQHGFRTGAPGIDFNAVFFCERRHHDRQVRVGMIDRQNALFLRGCQQTIMTVGTLIHCNVTDRCRSFSRLGGD